MANYRRVARRAARRHGLDPGVFERQIQQESGFQPHVRSGAGARGIAQIMPKTAAGWGVNPDNPRQALDAAAKNMAAYVRKYGSVENALRAYNAGPGAIKASHGYAETNNYVRTILAGHHPSSKGSKGGGGGRSSSSTTTKVTTSTPGVDNRVARAQLIQNFLSEKHSDPLNFAIQAKALRDVAPTSSTRSRTTHSGGDDGGGDDGGGGGAGGSALARMAAHRADAIDRQKLPYQWGGGHAGRTPLHRAIPLDCSGAVSKALGIDPRVSGQFQKWGHSGDGGNRGVTIYSNAKHVLMKINGHFFGTSASNPGGGAGWIPASQMSGQYLSGFTVRHSG